MTCHRDDGGLNAHVWVGGRGYFAEREEALALSPARGR